jgi:predicted class III extradiol MEMO1 family dioxygenase
VGADSLLWANEALPSTLENVEKSLSALVKALKSFVVGGKRLLILGAVDFAHVGPRFGDQLTLGLELDARVEKEDRLSIAHAAKLDTDAFYRSIVADGHWRKVCGLAATYTALRLLKGVYGQSCAGRLLTYGQAPDPMGGMVSFASIVFERPPGRKLAGNVC